MNSVAAVQVLKEPGITALTQLGVDAADRGIAHDDVAVSGATEAHLPIKGVGLAEIRA